MKKNFLHSKMLFILISILISQSTYAQNDWTNILPDKTVTDLLFVEDGVWLSVKDEGLKYYCYKGEAGVELSTDDGLLSNDIRAVAKDGIENLWIATDKGISYFNQTEWTNFTTSNSQITSDNVKDIQVDASGKVWMAFSNAIQVYNTTNETWKLFSTSTHSSFPNEELINIEINSSNEVWAAFPNTLLRINNNAFTEFSIQPWIIVNDTGPIAYWHNDTIIEEITYVSLEYEDRVRVGTIYYQAYVNYVNNHVEVNNGYDIGGNIYFEASDSYWWGEGTFFNHKQGDSYQGTIINYENPKLDLTNDIGKTPYHIDHFTNLWLISSKGVSILWRNNSSPSCIQIEMIEEIPGEEEDSEISIVPNPNQGVFYLDVKGFEIDEIYISIFNVDGKSIYENLRYDDISKIDMSELGGGLYFVRVTTGSEIITERFNIF